jgi:hypothetical protein
MTETPGSYGEQGASYYFVQDRPAREVLFARAEFAVSIWRPEPEGGAADQYPNTGSVLATGYGGTPESSEQMLTLASGTYSFTSAPDATPASVQIGLQPMNRSSPTVDLGTPTDMPRDRFSMFSPPLPGIELRIGDRVNVNDLNQNRYEIRQVFAAQSGFWGYSATVENIND